MKKYLIPICILLSLSTWLSGQYDVGFTSYKLSNGLTVYLWPDKNQADVSGVVTVRAGAIDEPVEYTGLAHYLEHAFKGTENCALDWEKEKPHYEKIIQLYDEYAATEDPVKRTI